MSSQEMVEKSLTLAMEEDFGRGDITTKLLIPDNLGGKAHITVNEDAVLAGGDLIKLAMLKVDQTSLIEVHFQDGSRVSKGDIVATVKGRVCSILKAERMLLNFLSRLSGVATETARYVEKVKGLKVKITDTRKTTPGLRMLEKYAVFVAGAQVHRPDLSTGVLIKDNHLVALRAKGVGIKDAIVKAKKGTKEGTKVEIEVNNLEQVKEAIEGVPDIIMLDNMSIEDMKKAKEIIPESIEIEASGNITLDNVRDVAVVGVDTISVGALTHSAKSIDFSLEFG
jgi:nicotinate-nucleotide pyrophosphorylase (carboxylating)